MGPFDPYQTWLDIPPSEQPPNYYRLLSLRRFETDPALIRAAADRVVEHVQRVATDEHRVACRQMLDRLAAAKACLLDAARKQEYDVRLRAMPVSPEVTLRSPPAPGQPAASAPTSPPGRGEQQIGGAPPVPGAAPAMPSAEQACQVRAPAPPVPGHAPTSPPAAAQAPAPTRPVPAVPTAPMATPLAGGPPAAIPATPTAAPVAQPVQPGVPVAAGPPPTTPPPAAPPASPPPAAPPGAGAPPAAEPVGQPQPSWAPAERSGRVGKAVASVESGGPRPVATKTTAARRARRRVRNQSTQIQVVLVLGAAAIFIAAVLITAVWMAMS